jgi:biopolymer transport protein ExbB
MTLIKMSAGLVVLLATAMSLPGTQAQAQAPNSPPPAAATLQPVPTAPIPSLQAPAAPAPNAQPPAVTPSAVTPSAAAPSVALPAAASAPATSADAPASAAPVPGVQASTSPVKNPALPHDLSPWGMFMGADLVVKVVMIGLAFASFVTWTICVAKMLELRTETSRAKRRIEVLGNDISLAEAEQDARDGRDAVALLVRSAATEAAMSDSIRDDSFKERVELRLSRVEAAMSRRIARGTGVLATIGATAPFVGLFGTVWGIMNSFIGISEAHTTNLAVVAPGIAEALLATAMGLIAAIPAVVIYNHLVRMISAYRALLGDATAQVMLLISRDQGRRSLRLARAAE